jgi:hypothetical protein
VATNTSKACAASQVSFVGVWSVMSIADLAHGLDGGWG